MLRVTIHSLPVVIALALALPARSNGDLFFEAQEIAGKTQYVLFGKVKDENGVFLEGATVTVTVTEPRLIYTSETDILGHFRSLDVGRAVAGLGYKVDPSRIEITVSYPGYHVARRMYRGMHRQSNGAVEWNFVMARD
jgi:hypothetical protein